MARAPLAGLHDGFSNASAVEADGPVLDPAGERLAQPPGTVEVAPGVALQPGPIRQTSSAGVTSSSLSSGSA
jgi:hypothetical protein